VTWWRGQSLVGRRLCQFVLWRKIRKNDKTSWLCHGVSVFERPSNIQWSFEIVNFLIMQLSSFSCYFLPPRSEYLLSRFPCQNTCKLKWLYVIQESKLKNISLAFTGENFWFQISGSHGARFGDPIFKDATSCLLWQTCQPFGGPRYLYLEDTAVNSVPALAGYCSEPAASISSILHWRRKQRVLPKRWYLSTKLHDNAFQEEILFRTCSLSKECEWISVFENKDVE
jgi:hypothetical protein